MSRNKYITPKEEDMMYLTQHWKFRKVLTNITEQ